MQPWGSAVFLKINPIISICYGSEARFCDFHFDPSPYACSYAVALDKLSVQEHKHFFGTLMKAHASLDRYLESFRALLGANIERVLGIRMAPAEWKLEVTPPHPAGYKHRPGLSIPLRPVVVLDSHGRFPRPFRAPFYPATGPAGLCQYLPPCRPMGGADQPGDRGYADAGGGGPAPGRLVPGSGLHSSIVTSASMWNGDSPRRG